MRTALRLIVAGLGSAFIGFGVAVILGHIVFAKNIGVAATLIGVAVGIYVFIKVRRSILDNVP